MGLFPITTAVWGTLGQWASAVGTTSAFSATFYVILRDARIRRVAQVKKVAFNFSMRRPILAGREGQWFVTIENLSEEPIYDVRIVTFNHKTPQTSTQRYVCINPKWSVVINRPMTPIGHGQQTYMEVRDNNGSWWHKSLAGELKRRPRRIQSSAYLEETMSGADGPVPAGRPLDPPFESFGPVEH